MKHLGDITKIDGHKIDPVDVVTGGSPCQDLSIAGARAGLAGKRSGLFMEQIRIIKEMRDRDRSIGRPDRAIRPRWMVFENVYGALSSGTPKGEDFRIILEETARIIDETAVIPRPPNGKWSYAGCIILDGGSIAWRVHNSQFWGLPQRRVRLALVGDFAGYSAPEVLFERESRFGNPKSSETPRKGNTETTGDSTPVAISFQERAGKPGGKGILIQEDRTGALSTVNNQMVLWKGISGDISGPIDSNYYRGTGNRGGREREVVYSSSPYSVRRLIPLEVERLQGFPDNWTDIGEWTDSKNKIHSSTDSMRWKALGNSIATPFWFWLLRRISAQYERPATLGSLFDGIGGFPYCWERCNGKGTAIWASEIDEFPIAVTRYHFPEERIGDDE